jgi:hypothetical protein
MLTTSVIFNKLSKENNQPFVEKSPNLVTLRRFYIKKYKILQHWIQDKKEAAEVAKERVKRDSKAEEQPPKKAGNGKGKPPKVVKKPLESIACKKNETQKPEMHQDLFSAKKQKPFCPFFSANLKKQLLPYGIE